MLKVALCDDEATQRVSAGKLLQEYATLHPQLAVKLSVFSSGRELLDAAEENGGFDLYLLDVVMPDLTGIELGVKLRKLGLNGLIIYLTISPEFAVDSYEARAFYYLMKPAEQAQLYPVLDSAVKTLESGKPPVSRSKPGTACGFCGWTPSCMWNWLAGQYATICPAGSRWRA